MLKNDRWIIEQAKAYRMIEPFEPKLVSKGISFGESSYGYDFRISDEFQVFKGNPSEVPLDPKHPDPSNFEPVKKTVLTLPANTYALGRTIEYFRIPRNILTICFGKSTYARCGVMMNITPFEPEWEGYATIAIINTASRPVKIYSGEGIAQLLFLEASEGCETSYADRKGKYNKQQQITLSKI